jgi:hypothetical protein
MLSFLQYLYVEKEENFFELFSENLGTVRFPFALLLSSFLEINVYKDICEIETTYHHHHRMTPKH